MIHEMIDLKQHQFSYVFPNWQYTLLLLVRNIKNCSRECGVSLLLEAYEGSLAVE